MATLLGIKDKSGMFIHYFGILRDCTRICFLSCLIWKTKGNLVWNAELDEAQAGIKIAGYQYLRYEDDTTLMTESEEKLKSLLMNVKEESEKVGLKLSIQKMKIMASGPITSWEIDGETMETVTDFIFLGSKITEDGDCSHEIKRHLPLGRKAMTNLENILESSDITLLAQVHIVKAVVFPVWMWELDYKEGWMPNNWCFWTVVLEKTLESLLDWKEIKPVNSKGNQSWIFIGRTDAKAEAPILWPPDAKILLFSLTGKDPDAGKDWRQEDKGITEDMMAGWHHWWMDKSLSKLRDTVKDREAWCATVHGAVKS